MAMARRAGPSSWNTKNGRCVLNKLLTFLTAAVAATGTAWAEEPATALNEAGGPSKKPLNVVMIEADDLNPMTLGYMGHRVVRKSLPVVLSCSISRRPWSLSMAAVMRYCLFVGSREAVFAYDPDGKGGYKPAVELYRFPSHSWIYDVVVRGNDL
jgi:hypothetical protein